MEFISSSLDCKRKFRNFWNSTKAVRNLSDRLCLERGVKEKLSVFLSGDWGKPLTSKKAECVPLGIACRYCAVSMFTSFLKRHIDKKERLREIKSWYNT